MLHQKEFSDLTYIFASFFLSLVLSNMIIINKTNHLYIHLWRNIKHMSTNIALMISLEHVLDLCRRGAILHTFETTQDLLIMRCATDHRSQILLILKVTLICSGCMLNKNTWYYKKSLQQAFLFYSLQLFRKHRKIENFKLFFGDIIHWAD